MNRTCSLQKRLPERLIDFPAADSFKAGWQNNLQPANAPSCDPADGISVFQEITSVLGLSKHLRLWLLLIWEGKHTFFLILVHWFTTLPIRVCCVKKKFKKKTTPHSLQVRRVLGNSTMMILVTGVSTLVSQFAGARPGVPQGVS